MDTGKNNRHLYPWLLLLSFLMAASLAVEWYRSSRSTVRIGQNHAPSAIGTGHAPSGAGPSSPVSQDGPSASPADNDEQEQETIPVYLVGAVVRPGIYHVAAGSYLYEVVEAAGGLRDDAATDQINLAMRLDCNQLIRLPTQEEARTGGSQIWPEPVQTATPLIDINQAGQSQLETLPGIGPATARAIIVYRETNGPFNRIEDLMKVPGIKEARYEALKDLIAVNALSG